MSVRQRILQKLTGSNNLAVERVVEQAILARPGPREQAELFEVIVARNKRAGWVALIKAYDTLSDEVREKLLARGRDLYGPLSEAMHDSQGPTRPNVIDIVQKSDDPRLVLLLAEALIDSRPELRQRAGESLLAAVQKHRARIGAAEESDEAADMDAADELRRAVDYAMRQYKTHKQDAALLAALLFERQQDASIWVLFQDPREELSKAAAAMLRTPPPTVGPDLTVATMLALASPLKPAAMARLAGTEELDMGLALIRESFRLLDPVLSEVTRGIGHLKILPAMWKIAPPNERTWAGWLRLVEAAGLQPVERVMWLVRLMEKAPPKEEWSVTWKLSVMRSLAETGAAEAGRVFARQMADADERVARSAARYLLSRRHPEWRAMAVYSGSPHACVQRMVGTVQMVGGGRNGSLMSERVNAVVGPTGVGPDPSFGRVWEEYSRMPAAVSHTAARTLAANDPEFNDQMKAKLASRVTAEVALGLKMIGILPDLSPFRPQIITLCRHADVRVAASAVKLIGRLEDPRLKDLLEAAAQHADPRVRANAVESMAALHIAGRSQQVLNMLNSRHSRERANAIKAISDFDFATARECLMRMLGDANPLHRISALWVVQQLGFPALFRMVSSVARRDPNARVRKRASEMVETLTGNPPPQTARREN